MTSPRHLLPLLALLAALLQGGAAAHAAAYGDGPHGHDGVPCAWALHGDRDGDELLPPSGASSPAMPVPVPVAYAFSGRIAVVPPSVVVPPGRGPPHSS